MTIDPTISYGAILNAAALLVGFLVAFIRLGGRIDILSIRLGAVEDAVKGNSSTDKRLAILEDRQTNHATLISTIQRDLSDLRHGDGYVIGRRVGIDGEYP